MRLVVFLQHVTDLSGKETITRVTGEETSSTHLLRILFSVREELEITQLGLLSCSTNLPDLFLELYSWDKVQFLGKGSGCPEGRVGAC